MLKWLLQLKENVDENYLDYRFNTHLFVSYEYGENMIENDNFFTSIMNTAMDNNEEYGYLKPIYLDALYIEEDGWINAFGDWHIASISVREFLEKIKEEVDASIPSDQFDDTTDNTTFTSEEDTESSSGYSISNDTLSEDSDDSEEAQPSKCFNENVMTLEPYESNNELFVVKTQNSRGKFVEGFCSTISEMYDYLQADRVTDSGHSNIFMGIWMKKSGQQLDESGYGGICSNKIVFRMPFGIYITLGSLERILSEKTRVWYALPLYEGKRRRIGNLESQFGVSMNHGQIPGFVIHKLYTKEEISKGVYVQDKEDDYPVRIFPQIDGSLQETLENAIDLGNFHKGLIRMLQDLIIKYNPETY